MITKVYTDSGHSTTRNMRFLTGHLPKSRFSDPLCSMCSGIDQKTLIEEDANLGEIQLGAGVSKHQFMYQTRKILPGGRGVVAAITHAVMFPFFAQRSPLTLACS